MGLFIASINSGSNGNCYYVGNSEEAILVDAGISLKETEKRMSRLGLDLTKVKAIFISHEHSDHITGLPGLSKKYQLPVYITAATLKGCNLPVEEHLVFTFQKDHPVNIGSLSVNAFSKTHDAADPHSFVVSQAGLRIGVMTDIGNCCAEVVKHFSSCQAVFLESNYCEDMLANGRYPYFLKKRISGGQGHLSNREALDLFTRHRSQSLTHLILSHLSSNNNNRELVHNLFTEKANGVNIVVASRFRESEVYHIETRLVEHTESTILESIITSEPSNALVTNVVSNRKDLIRAASRKSTRPTQLSLFS